MDKGITAGDRRTRTVVAITLGVWSLVAFGPPNAAAEDVSIVLDMPVVVAAAVDGQVSDIQVRDANDASEAGVISAMAGNGAGHGEVRVGLVDVVQARSRGEGGSGSGAVYMGFTVEDPQHRPEIKTILKFNGVVATQPDPPDSNSFKDAQWAVRLGQSDGAPFIMVVHDDLTFNFVSGPQIVGTPVFSASANAMSQAGGLCLRRIEMNGAILTNEYAYGCTNTAVGGILELTHAPGDYLLQSNATAGNYGLAIGDPVWEPHPDYADVVITRHAPPGLPSAPLGDTTPEELAADGIDPTLFIEAGFFADPTPPQPTGAPTPVPTATGPTPIPTASASPVPAGSKKCDPTGADAAAITAARARIDRECPCNDYDGSQGKKHGDYVHCATDTVKALVRDALLKKSCKRFTQKCAASSTCGSPGFVTCQLTTARLHTTCAIKAAPDRCVAPRGGNAEVTATTSCCDIGAVGE